jgi:alpha-ribazole phosphatase
MSTAAGNLPTRWWWIRHAPVPDAAGRLNGRRDVDCDTSDAACFVPLAALLPSGAVTVISPLRRTRQTYEALRGAGAALTDPLIEPDFAEQSFGRWEGLRWSDMQAREPDAYARFWQDPVHNAPPAGESFAAQMQRTATAIERLSTGFEGRDVISVSHGGTIRAAVAHALALSPLAAMAIVVDNLTLTRLDRLADGLLQGVGRVWRVQMVNAPVVRQPAPPPPPVRPAGNG